MTDRELLEKAARAAGISSDGLGTCFDMDRGQPWDPLNEDGDALRLAVRLNMMVTVAQGTSYADHYHDTDPNISEPHGDPYAATRRAIVRAAAAIADSTAAKE